MDVPVYLFTGFLESGKTSFMLNVLQDQGFNEGEKTLIIACEEGIVEFDSEILHELNCEVAYIEDQSEFTTETLARLDKKYEPKIVMIEFNGVWSLAEVLDRIELPASWALAQIVSTIDASTFSNYLSNMRSIMYEQLVDSEMIIFNRCSEKTKKSFLRSNIKAINRTAQIIYESVDGSVNTLPEDELPFDINKPLIKISDDDFGLWYMDALEHPDKYVGKMVEVKGKAFEPMDESIASCAFVLGRYAMVCCADDTQPIGFLTYWEYAGKLIEEEWVQVQAKMDKVYDDDYQKEVPVLKVEQLKVVPPMEDELVYFN